MRHTEFLQEPAPIMFNCQNPLSIPILKSVQKIIKLQKTIDEVTCDVKAMKICTVAPQYAHASLGKYF